MRSTFMPNPSMRLLRRRFRSSGAILLAPPLGPATEFVVVVEKPAVEHRVTLAQLQKWTGTR